MINWQHTAVCEESRQLVDKLGPGPWTEESDEYFGIFEDPTTGYTFHALAIRGPLGALCGYMGVTKHHPLFGIAYSDDARIEGLQVHGGITFSGRHEKNEWSLALDLPDENWWIGFDCNHAFDFVPSMALVANKYEGFSVFGDDHAYKNIGYVTEQIDHLGQQLKGIN